MSDRYVTFDGRWEPVPDTRGMLVPVRCAHCGEVYDLCNTTAIGRYADCTTFNTPCCKRFVDDRPWLDHFTRLDGRS